jgi:hypothetical protein
MITWLIMMPKLAYAVSAGSGSSFRDPHSAIRI